MLNQYSLEAYSTLNTGSNSTPRYMRQPQMTARTNISSQYTIRQRVLPEGYTSQKWRVEPAVIDNEVELMKIRLNFELLNHKINKLNSILLPKEHPMTSRSIYDLNYSSRVIDSKRNGQSKHQCESERQQQYQQQHVSNQSRNKPRFPPQEGNKDDNSDSCNLSDIANDLLDVMDEENKNEDYYEDYRSQKRGEGWNKDSKRTVDDKAQRLQSLKKGRMLNIERVTGDNSMGENALYQEEAGEEFTKDIKLNNRRKVIKTDSNARENAQLYIEDIEFEKKEGKEILKSCQRPGEVNEEMPKEAIDKTNEEKTQARGKENCNQLEERLKEEVIQSKAKEEASNKLGVEERPLENEIDPCNKDQVIIQENQSENDPETQNEIKPEGHEEFSKGDENNNDNEEEENNEDDEENNEEGENEEVEGEEEENEKDEVNNEEDNNEVQSNDKDQRGEEGELKNNKDNFQPSNLTEDAGNIIDPALTQQNPALTKGITSEDEDMQILDSIASDANAKAKEEKEKNAKDEEDNTLTPVKDTPSKPKKTVQFSDKSLVTISYNEKEKITQLALFDVDGENVKFKPRNMNRYITLLSSAKPRPIMLNSPAKNQEIALETLNNLINEEKEEEAKKLPTSNSKNSITSSSSVIMQRNILKCQEIQNNKKQGAKTFWRIKEKHYVKKVIRHNCKRFEQNPQKFFTEDLCPNVLNSYDIETPCCHRTKSCSPSKVNCFSAQERQENRNDVKVVAKIKDQRKDAKKPQSYIKDLKEMVENVKIEIISEEKEDTDRDQPKEEANLRRLSL